MKKLIVFFVLAFGAYMVHAQADVMDAHYQAMTEAQSGNMDKAISIIKNAEANNPNSLVLLKDDVLLNTTNKQYNSAIAAGKQLIALPDADDQSYQALGAAYAGAGQNTEAVKVYREGIQRFPASGVLYAEYGDVLSNMGNTSEAAKIWELGIQADPTISGNYYSLSKYYAAHQNPLWSVLYGEIFINIETFSTRTHEIKDAVFQQYRALFAADNVLQNYMDNGQPFEKAVAATLFQFKDMVSEGVTPESLDALRGQFLVNWFSGDNAKNFPYKLFDRQLQLSKIGIFSAYNQWLFSSYNQNLFTSWAQLHNGEINEFSKFQRSSIFNVPKGQYYQHN